MVVIRLKSRKVLMDEKVKLIVFININLLLFYMMIIVISLYKKELI